MSLTARPPSFMRRFSAAETSDPNTLVALACDESYWVRRQAVKNPATPRWILNLLVRAGATADLRGKGQPDPTLDGDSLRKLVSIGTWTRQLAAEHPNTPPDVLDELRKEASLPLRLTIAKHVNTAPATLASLCADIEEAVRVQAAAHPHCPQSVITLLMEAGAASDLQTAVNPQPTLSTEQLHTIADLGAWGRFLAARHPASPLDLLADISKDPDWRVRSGLFDNPNLPLEMMATLVDAEDVALVQQLSLPTPPPDILDTLSHHARVDVRLAVARHPAISTAQLGWLATDGNKDVRRAVARQPQTNPEDIGLLVSAGSSADLMQLSDPDLGLTAVKLNRLSQRGQWGRMLVVRHPNTAPDTLARLICDADPKIREWAAVHPHAPQEIIQLLFRAGCGTDFQGFAPPDPTLPPESLRQLVKLGVWAEWVVAANPNTPRDLLETLAQVEDKQVRQFAIQNLNGNR